MHLCQQFDSRKNIIQIVLFENHPVKVGLAEAFRFVFVMIIIFFPAPFVEPVHQPDLIFRNLDSRDTAFSDAASRIKGTGNRECAVIEAAPYSGFSFFFSRPFHLFFVNDNIFFNHLFFFSAGFAVLPAEVFYFEFQKIDF